MTTTRYNYNLRTSRNCKYIHNRTDLHYGTTLFTFLPAFLWLTPTQASYALVLVHPILTISVYYHNTIPGRLKLYFCTLFRSNAVASMSIKRHLFPRIAHHISLSYVAYVFKSTGIFRHSLVLETTRTCRHQRWQFSLRSHSHLTLYPFSSAAWRSC